MTQTDEHPQRVTKDKFFTTWSNVCLNHGSLINHSQKKKNINVLFLVFVEYWNEQTQMYVCTYVHFDLFILVDVVTCCTSGIWYMDWELNWFIYKRINRHGKMWKHNSQLLDTEEKWELHSTEKSGYWDLNLWNAISMFVLWLAPFDSMGFSLTLKFSSVTQTVRLWQLGSPCPLTRSWINSFLPIVSFWPISQ